MGLYIGYGLVDLCSGIDLAICCNSYFPIMVSQQVVHNLLVHHSR